MNYQLCVHVQFIIHMRDVLLILVIDSFSLKPASVTEQKDLVIKGGFFVILKSPNHFRTMQFIIAN